MQEDIRTHRLERKRTRFRREMRKLKRWGQAIDADCDPIYECYRYTRDKGNEIDLIR